MYETCTLFMRGIITVGGALVRVNFPHIKTSCITHTLQK